jgi:hypothetical protein
VNNDPSFQRCAEFVQERLAQSGTLPTVISAAERIVQMALDYQDEMAPDYAGGYADAAEDALYAISGIWRYHYDYQGWASDGQ